MREIEAIIEGTCVGFVYDKSIVSLWSSAERFNVRQLESENVVRVTGQEKDFVAKTAAGIRGQHGVQVEKFFINSPHFAKRSQFMATMIGYTYDKVRDVYITFYPYIGPDAMSLTEDNFFKEDHRNRWKFVEESRQGLQFLHANGITHCDVKLENFCLKGADGNGDEREAFRFVMIDLELSQAIGNLKDIRRWGTTTHMPPEAFVNEEVTISHAVDAFSWGVTLSNAFSGFAPWVSAHTNDTKYDRFRCIDTANNADLIGAMQTTFFRHSMSRDEVAIVLAGMRHDPANRLRLDDSTLVAHVARCKADAHGAMELLSLSSRGENSA